MNGIDVNAVAPGFIDADMTKNLGVEIKQKLLSNTPFGRIGTPEDLAKLVVFLCPDTSNYIRGQMIGADGAQVM